MKNFAGYLINILKVFLGIAISMVFLYIAFKDFKWENFYNALTKVNFLLLFLASTIIAGMFIIRGYRWSLFLKPVKKIGVISLSWSTAIGFGVNNVLPARLGEVARAYSIYKKENIPFGAAFGTIVVERLYDTFSALVLFVGCLFFIEFPDISNKLLGRSQAEVAVFLALIVMILIAVIVLLKTKTDMMLKIAGFFLSFLPKRWVDKILELMRNFISGLTQTKNPLEAVWIVLLSFILWAISAFTVWLVIYACGYNIGPSQTITVLMSLVFAVSIPAAPGYAGTYHAFCKEALILVGIQDPDVALSIATVIHAANYIPQTLLGIGALLFEGIKFSDVKKAKQRIDMGESI